MYTSWQIEMCNGKVNKDIKKNIQQQPRNSCFQNEVLSYLETINQEGCGAY